MWSGADEIWNRLKQSAKDWAASGRQLPSEEECAEIARTTVEAALGSGTAVSAEALEFYSAEFCAMVEDLRRERNVSH